MGNSFQKEPDKTLIDEGLQQFGQGDEQEAKVAIKSRYGPLGALKAAVTLVDDLQLISKYPNEEVSTINRVAFSVMDGILDEKDAPDSKKPRT